MALGIDVRFFPGSAPLLDLVLTLQRGAQRLTPFGIDKGDRETRRCVLRASSGVVH
jgi:hypothetical protein